MNTESGVRYDEYGMILRTGRDPHMVMEVGAGEESGGESNLSAVEAAAFNDTTPIAETFEEGELPAEDEIDDENHEESEQGDEGDQENHEEEDDENVEHDDEPIASFTDLEAANKHIAKLNRENARRRAEGKEYDEVFAPFTPEARNVLLGVMSNLATDQETGARQLLQIAKNILGEDALKPEEEMDPNEPMTYAKWQELQAKEKEKEAQQRQQREQAEADEQAVKAIFTKAEELGYKEANAERHLLLSLAAADTEHGGTGGNLDKAHEAVTKFKQSIIDQYVSGKSQQADDFPITGEGAQPASVSKEPKTWNDFIDQGTEMANASRNVGK